MSCFDLVLIDRYESYYLFIVKLLYIILHIVGYFVVFFFLDETIQIPAHNQHINSLYAPILHA